MIEQFEGDFAYGWALSDLGPILVSGSKMPSLYSRWVSHIVWRDKAHRLWEVTPHADVFGSGGKWSNTIFVADESAQFESASEHSCCPLPAVYIAVRPEGEWTADCLCQAERAPLAMQDQWLNRALYSLKCAGYTPINWRVQRMHDKISDAWLLA